MNGRQFTLGISGRPLAQFFAMIVMGVVLVAAVVMGAFVLMALLGLFVIAYLVLKARSWWRTYKPGGRGPFRNGPGPGSGAAKGIRYIDAEFEIVKTDANAGRRPGRR
jgi:hypothetical protein